MLVTVPPDNVACKDTCSLTHCECYFLLCCMVLVIAVLSMHSWAHALFAVSQFEVKHWACCMLHTVTCCRQACAAFAVNSATTYDCPYACRRSRSAASQTHCPRPPLINCCSCSGTGRRKQPPLKPQQQQQRRRLLRLVLRQQQQPQCVQKVQQGVC
jgi:hypothetical protein